MSDRYILERIGKRLRDAAGGAVEEQLPDHWRTLIGRLAKLEQCDGRCSTQRAERRQR